MLLLESPPTEDSSAISMSNKKLIVLARFSTIGIIFIQTTGCLITLTSYMFCKAEANNWDVCCSTLSLPWKRKQKLPWDVNYPCMVYWSCFQKFFQKALTNCILMKGSGFTPLWHPIGTSFSKEARTSHWWACKNSILSMCVLVGRIQTH